MHPVAILASTGLLVASLAPPSASASVAGDPQAKSKSTSVLIHAERLITRPGSVLENQAVLVQDGKIVAIGAGLTAPEGAQELTGKWVCAGFIDPWSAFGVDPGALGDERASAATQSVDGWDPFVDARFRKELLRSGVTSMRVQAGAAAKISGMGAFVRNHPSITDRRAVLLSDCCLALNIGISRNGRGIDIFDRVGDVERAVGALADGLSYLQDQIDYKHDLETWQKTIADKQKELDDGFKKAKKDREKDEADAKKNGKEFKDKTYKEDKRPKAPRHDDDREVLARAVNGGLPLIVEVHRAIELRGWLEGTAKFDRLRMVIAGASEALDFADTLKERKIAVLVAPRPLGKLRTDEERDADPALAGRLAAAGVQVLIGSGGDSPMATRDLALLAEIAIGYGLDRQTAFEALTIGAARALDVGDRLGSIEIGKDADLLVLDGEPLVSTSRVQYVLSGGDVVVQPEE